MERLSIHVFGMIAAKCKGVRLGFFSRFFADPVEIRRHARVRSVHQVVGKLVKHHEQFFVIRQSAVECDVMPAEHTVIKTACPERHFDNRYLSPFAQFVKIAFGQRPFIPLTAKP